MSDLEPKCRPIRLILLFSFLICSSAADEELQILLDLKSNLRSSNLTLFDSWTPHASPCSFAGISCVTPGAVTGIDLTGKGLSGILPIGSICRLPSLRKLALGTNSLVGNLRGDFKNCGNLEYLDLSFNGLTGTVPDLSSLLKLQVLNLSDNGFTGPFPWSSLKNLTELGVLSLGDNPFDKSSFPSEILSLKKIYWIYLANCTLEGKIPPEIGDLQELVHLELSTNNFTGEIPAEITKLKKLTMLEIYENQLTGKLPVGFGNLSNLEFFDASANLLEGDLQELRFLTKIISLQLYENQFSGEIPAEFGYFKSLVNLSLYSNKLSGSLPQTLGSWAKFDFIDVSDNGFTGPIPPDMCKRGTMTRLLLLDNQFSGEIPASYGNCSSLVRFRVTNNKLSGKVPVKIWGLPNVVIIDLTGNNFEGPLTSDIQGAISLGTLSLAFNRFSGDFPPEISKVTSLVSIDAQFNKFSGNIPSGIGNLKMLDSLYLQNNLLSGKIPGELGSCVSISQINLAGNSLSGQIPGSLGTLQTLNSLNLSGNDISGHIPASLSALKLSYFDLSNNRLSGQIPQALSIEAYAKSYDGNPGLCSQIITNFRPCPTISANSSHFRTLISCLFIGTAISVAFLAYLIFHRKRKSDHSRSFKDDSWNLKSFQILSFSEQEILNGINQENLIGKGGSGNVYKVALPSGKDLAVKHIWNVGQDGRKSTSAMLARQPGKLSEFDAEVAVLSSIRHVNVVKLYCSITSEDSSLLVYEYMPNGSLWDRMHTCQKMELDWGTRYDVAVGAAKGLEYLHHGCERPVIHRDVKSSNILLDEFFKPRIADFGLARIVVPAIAGKDSTHVIAGTHGYIAPEYAYTYKVNEKSDVYSFGVVLMELVTGKRPIEPEFGENKDIVGWISTKMTSRESVMGVVDPNIPKSLHEDVVKVLRIGVLCTAKLPSLRPTMRTVVQLLEDAEPCKFMSIIFKDGKEGETKEKTSPNH